MDTTIKKLVGFGSILIVIFVILGGSFYYKSIENGQNLTNEDIQSAQRAVLEKTSRMKLLSTNQNFQRAEKLFKEGNFNEAIVEYTEAKNSTDDKGELGQIEYLIANTLLKLGKNAEAVSKLKEISDNTEYTKIIRAYSVETMGRIYTRTRDPKIFDLIFSKSPYEEMVSKNIDKTKSATETMINLNKFALSLYPFSLSALTIAQSQSAELRTNTKLTDDQKAILEDQISNMIVIARNDFTRLEIQDPDNVIVSLFKLSGVLSNLRIAGITKYSDPEPLFKDLLSRADTSGNKNDTVEISIQYAKYLTYTSGESRKADVNNLLKVIPQILSSNPNLPYNTFLKNLKADTGNFLHKDLVKIALLEDGVFKEHLEKNGWVLK